MTVMENLTVTRAASYRKPAFMGLGNVFRKPTKNLDTMMRRSGLDSLLITEESLSFEFGDARMISPQKAILASVDNERKVLGIVGLERPVILPTEALSFLRDLMPGLEWEIAGTLRDDRTVFGALRWERETIPGNGDSAIMHYLVVCYSFDGTMPLTVFVTDIRPECMNTIHAGIRSAVQSFKIRHTKNARERMAVQAEMFKKANAYVDVMDNAFAEMLAVPMDDNAFDDFLLAQFPKPEKDVKGSLSKWDDKRDAHFAAWNADYNANVRGTAFGVFNVMAEVMQWGRQTREGEKGTEAFFLAGAGFDPAVEKARAALFSDVRKAADLSPV